MKDANKYFEKTKDLMPNKLVQRFMKMKIKPSNAVELGCGAGKDTVYLIKNGWNVTAVDKENVEKFILEKLDEVEKHRLKFENQSFEKLNIEKNNLVVANFSLSFCKCTEFDKMWKRINESILPDGYFVGNIFGINDELVKIKNEMTFLNKHEVLKLFDDFDIIFFNEIEEDSLTAMGKMKHWHVFYVIAKKR